MKITYERLNQIIEEEVVKFKRLNENLDLTKLNAEFERIKSLPTDQATLDKIVSSLAAITGSPSNTNLGIK